MDDYCTDRGRRKTKCDRKAQRRYKIYKRGGKYRSTNVALGNKGKEGGQNGRATA